MNRSWNTDIPEGWVPPKKPTVPACGCGGQIEPRLRPPIFLGGRLIDGGVWVTHAACEECLRTAEQRRLEHVKSAETKAYLAKAGFHLVHQTMTLENVQAPSAVLMDAARGWIGGNNGLWMFGTTGTGKTYLAAALLREFITKENRPGRFCSVARLIQDLRLASQTALNLDVEDLARTDALVLDDVGMERPTPFAQEQLFLLVDALWTNSRRRVVVTSNLSPDALVERLGAPIVSRLVSLCRVVEVSGEDRRLRKK